MLLKAASTGAQQLSWVLLKLSAVQGESWRAAGAEEFPCLLQSPALADSLFSLLLLEAFLLLVQSKLNFTEHHQSVLGYCSPCAPSEDRACFWPSSVQYLGMCLSVRLSWHCKAHRLTLDLNECLNSSRSLCHGALSLLGWWPLRVNHLWNSSSRSGGETWGTHRATSEFWFLKCIERSHVCS